MALSTGEVSELSVVATAPELALPVVPDAPAEADPLLAAGVEPDAPPKLDAPLATGVEPPPLPVSVVTKTGFARPGVLLPAGNWPVGRKDGAPCGDAAGVKPGEDANGPAAASAWPKLLSGSSSIGGSCDAPAIPLFKIGCIIPTLFLDDGDAANESAMGLS
jgi:hypothetical protein